MVGCLLEMDAAGQTASLSFALNGENMGVAFQDVQLAPALPSTGDLLKVRWGMYLRGNRALCSWAIRSCPKE